MGSGGHVAVEASHDVDPCEVAEAHDSAGFVFTAAEAGCTDSALSQMLATRPSDSAGASVKLPVSWAVVTGAHDFKPMSATLAAFLLVCRDSLSATGRLRALRSVILLV